jgi:hypothetical protein
MAHDHTRRLLYKYLDQDGETTVAVMRQRLNSKEAIFE